MIPVSLSGGVEPGARTGTSVNGRLVVLWRGQDGRVRAWADRCPHRGMRLSFGFIRENTLTCVYHGWSFGDPPAENAAAGNAAAGSTAAGAPCLTVPAHPSLAPPAKAAVPVLPVTEALGLIWVGDGPADTRPPAAVHGQQPVYPVRSVTVNAPAAALRAAFESTLPPGAEAAESAGQPDVVTFKGPAGLVIAALQDRGDGAASAHVVTTDPDRAARQALCQWAALVRDHLAAVVLP
jgi:nitrite reductase/ring-hydroxylating ferredoxin subunit